MTAVMAFIQAFRSGPWRSPGVCRSLWLLLLWLCLPTMLTPAWAHKSSDAYVHLVPEGTALLVRVDVALRDLDRELVLDADDDGALRWGEIRQRENDLHEWLSQGSAWRVRDRRGQDCQAGEVPPLQIDRHSDGSYAVLQRRWRCADGPGQVTVAYRLFARTDPTHRGVVRIERAAGSAVMVLVPGAGPVNVALIQDGAAAGHPADGRAGSAGAAGSSGAVLSSPDAATLTSWRTLFLEGIHHIWIGVDHVLFLVVLLLPAVMQRERRTWAPAPALRPALGEMVGVVTAFTVAHSITLGLAVFGVIDPPSRWVESLIALSVALAALNNLRPVLLRQRWRLTFAFGLVHGFGFAGALKDLGLMHGELAVPLLMFNLGVETGQLVIVALLVPLLWTLRRWSGYARWVLGLGSAVTLLLALVWLAERLFDLRLLEARA